MKISLLDKSEVVFGYGEPGRPHAAAAFFNIGTILDGPVNVARALDVQSQVPLFDSGEGDRIFEVGDSLKVRCAFFACFFLEGVPGF